MAADRPFVPAEFVVPRILGTTEFRLEPFGPEHNDADYAAWSSSADHIHATPAAALLRLTCGVSFCMVRLPVWSTCLLSATIRPT